MSTAAEDRRFLLAAVRLARRGLGRVWPNPSVGALIVARNEAGEPVVVGRGVTGRPGTGHAEARALADAGEKARGATCYVTLEPCSHFGRTPPCSLALIEAGVARVVVGVEDPNPRVAGRGIALLRKAGIEVEVGVAREEALALHAGFIRRITENRPHVTLKMALSADGAIGRVGAPEGAAQIHLTGPIANAQVHTLRASHDAILVGIGTALGDDPSLTCRLPGMADRSPVRVVLDPSARLPLNATLVRTAAEVPVWLIVTADAPAGRIDALTSAGVLVIKVPANREGRIAPAAALAALAARGITTVLVEGGAHVADAFERAGLVDTMIMAHAPQRIGEGRLYPFADRSLDMVLADHTYVLTETGSWGPDRYQIFRRR